MPARRPHLSRTAARLPALAPAGWLALACGLALLFAGPARAEDDTFTLTIREHRFTTARLELPAGKKIKLIVRNLDATPEEFESVKLNREKVVPGGGEIVLFLGPLEPGTYDFFGEFHADTAKGEIIVR